MAEQTNFKQTASRKYLLANVLKSPGEDGCTADVTLIRSGVRGAHLVPVIREVSYWAAQSYVRKLAAAQTLLDKATARK